MGCETRIKEIEVPVMSCAGWKPIYYSKSDTVDTICQIRAHNAFYDFQCNGKQPVKYDELCTK